MRKTISEGLSNSFTRDPEHPFVFGSILFMGTWISMMIACINGSGIPILVRKFVFNKIVKINL